MKKWNSMFWLELFSNFNNELFTSTGSDFVSSLMKNTDFAFIAINAVKGRNNYVVKTLSSKIDMEYIQKV